ncbi:MAG: response regulator [Ectothiorhodospiraceae bacterium]|nr:response regulator [Ectothiorhodospiraceae bacterium]
MARILVVDDSKFVARAMTAALTSAGHEVIAIGHDGNEGAALFREHRPDLVLLDITMPNRDGRDCLADILATDPGARVVMVSAIKEQDVVSDCLAHGALDFISKPLQLGDPAYLEGFAATIDRAASGVARTPA